MRIALPDFANPSDWLNPILIKELRQAVRSPMFVSLFVIVQIAMVLYVTFSMATASTSANVSQSQTQFWNLVGAYMLFIHPLRGLNAIATEYRDGRFELLRITHLQAQKIALGKWLSLNIQCWLTVLSLMPYLALRYFTGAVNPLHELMILGGLIYGSLIATNLTVSASAARTRWGRSFFFVFGGFFLLLFSAIFGAATNQIIAAIILMGVCQCVISVIMFMAACSILERQTAEPMPFFEPTPYIRA
ncbi:hypothetical protein [Cerasicoccus frondis]|uniref:hypothetical protein n=1 Tax=Cerasicoccus frondis TaxID=490090 RepID=UPI002852C241|nr:hypothetical protein [Cerasicoccus frondis]